MTVPLSDNFSYPTGKITDYGSVQNYKPALPTASLPAYFADTYKVFNDSAKQGTRGSTDLTTALANEHVDVRGFYNEIVSRAFTQAELSEYHQAQRAFTQNIAVEAAPSSGNFTLTWEDEVGTVYTSSSIAYNVTKTTLQTTINSLLASANANTTVTVYETGVGLTRFPFTIVFPESASWVVKFGIGSSTLNNSANVAVTVSDYDTNYLQTADFTDDQYTQYQLENIIVSRSENWTISGSSYTLNELTIGEQAAYLNFRGVDIPLRAPLGTGSFDLISSMTTPLDITMGDDTAAYLSIVFPQTRATLTAAVNLDSSYVQLTSNTNGVFGTGADSAQIFFTAGNLATTEFRKVVSAFAAGTFDPEAVTGIKFHIVGTGTYSPNHLTIMGIRSVKSTWAPMPLDVDTIRGTLVPAVPLAFSTPELAKQRIEDHYTRHFPPLIRSASSTYQDADDPIPIDTSINIKFHTGNYNTDGATYETRAQTVIQAFVRESGNDSGSTVSYMSVGELRFGAPIGSQNIALLRYRMKRDAGVDTIVDRDGGYDYFINCSDLSPDDRITSGPVGLVENTNYLFVLEVVDNLMRIVLYRLDDNDNIVATHYDTGYDNVGIKSEGRIGWWASLQRGDQYIDYVTVSSTSYALLQTKTFYTDTPVEGAQLWVEGSSDQQLFTDLHYIRGADGGEVGTDAQKSLSGASYKVVTVNSGSGPCGVKTNSLKIDDWSKIQLSFDIWLPGNIARSKDSVNAPRIYFKAPGTTDLLDADTTVPLGGIPIDFIPNLWTRNNIDLSFLQYRSSGTYEIWFVFPNLTYDAWWLDNLFVNLQTVEWSFQANSQKNMRSFGRMINSKNKGLHLKPDERGRELKLQARALSQDAWISSYTLKPRYAPLGKINNVAAISTSISASDITVSAEKYYVNLTWKRHPLAEGYRIYYKKQADSTVLYSHSVGADTLSTRVFNLLPNTAYHVYVQPYNMNGPEIGSASYQTQKSVTTTIATVYTGINTYLDSEWEADIPLTAETNHLDTPGAFKDRPIILSRNRSTQFWKYKTPYYAFTDQSNQLIGNVDYIPLDAMVFDAPAAHRITRLYTDTLSMIYEPRYVGKKNPPPVDYSGIGFSSFDAIVSFTTPSIVSSNFEIGIVGRERDHSSDATQDEYLLFKITGASGTTASIVMHENTPADTTLATGSLGYTMAADTQYWLRAQLTELSVDISLYTSDPLENVSPVGSLQSYITNATAISKFPYGVLSTFGCGNLGLYFVPKSNLTATLSAAISTTNAATLTVSSNPGGLPSTPFGIIIDSEVLIVNDASTTTWAVARGARGTTAATHSNGATVTIGATVKINEFKAQRLAPKVGASSTFEIKELADWNQFEDWFGFPRPGRSEMKREEAVTFFNNLRMKDGSPVPTHIKNLYKEWVLLYLPTKLGVNPLPKVISPPKSMPKPNIPLPSKRPFVILPDGTIRYLDTPPRESGPIFRL